ncbi:WhiB family transcriptional regulator [Rhodococcus tibetensis]|uniref:Transcriptional regulator WhiB n=1 Tax=Rhodococcus tibetensis TaxID=2965064 RepID=A0ABT1QG13_9NOCA|nr:WhiB family transcriptional regulator [Rhodococcus sp. FXJ9.536]MCQ4120613.1 WhiB family transcriptional regulator [Rhodococcus sp. FXJ9.536]
MLVPTDTAAGLGRGLSSTSSPTREEIVGNWQLRAACRGTDLAVFFSPDGERGSARDRREAQARQICMPCPVLAQCRDHALTVGEPYGVWGGLTEADRRRRAQRPRRGEGRPLGSINPRPVSGRSR